MENRQFENSEENFAKFRVRILFTIVATFLLFGLLVYRLYVLQIKNHNFYSERAENNRTSIVPIMPARGQILDRNGFVLATNSPIFILEIILEDVPNLDKTLEKLSKFIEINENILRKFKAQFKNRKKFEPIILRDNLTEIEIANFSARNLFFPGVNLNVKLSRDYPLKEVASHVLGYVGRIDSKDAENIKNLGFEANYRGTDVIGKLGIEESYEQLLHGTTGWQKIEVASAGNFISLLAEKSAISGSDLVLSIDIKLQKMIEDLYGNRRGSLVAINPKNGEILALVSKPTYDLNLFKGGISHNNWKELNNSIYAPLLNRAIRGTYPPGSTYKPFMAIAGLESGKRKPTTIIQDNGSWNFGGHIFRSTHPLGPVDVHKAVVKSSNVYFYTLANEMGVDLIHKYLSPWSFGQLTGIDIKGERTGILPSTSWKQKTYNQRWFAGETISLGIGQGYNNFTMLQLALATATLANNGIKNRPHLAKGFLNIETRKYQNLAQIQSEKLDFKEENIQRIKNAVAQVPVEGTSRFVFARAPYKSAGKTGTAQAVGVKQNQKYDASKLDELQRDHSLYIAYAPIEDPEIALAIIVENSGFGAVAAAPIARRVFDYWLLGNYPSKEDILASQESKSRQPIGKPRQISEINQEFKKIDF